LLATSGADLGRFEPRVPALGPPFTGPTAHHGEDMSEQLLGRGGLMGRITRGGAVARGQKAPVELKALSSRRKPDLF
jgi:hypothetical protein